MWHQTRAPGRESRFMGCSKSYGKNARRRVVAPLPFLLDETAVYAAQFDNLLIAESAQLLIRHLSIAISGFSAMAKGAAPALKVIIKKSRDHRPPGYNVRRLLRIGLRFVNMSSRPMHDSVIPEKTRRPVLRAGLRSAGACIRIRRVATSTENDSRRSGESSVA